MRIITWAVLGLLMSLPNTALCSSDRLVFSEVYLYSARTGKSWIEIYNPSDSTLDLTHFRTSNVRTMNLLRDSIRIKPKQKVVLCADKGAFLTMRANYRNAVYEIKGLSFLSKEGFVAIVSNGNLLDESFENILWYGGESSISKKDNRYKKFVPFSQGNIGYIIIIKSLADSSKY